MKLINAIAAICTMSILCNAGQYRIDDISPHFSTNMPIIWKASLDQLPKSFWTYKIIPQKYAAGVISNAVVLAGFQKKGFPKPSTNQIVIWADNFEGEPRPPNLLIFPDTGQISYSLGDRTPESLQDESNSETIERTWTIVSQFGIDQNQLEKTNSNSDGSAGIFLSRKIDGLTFQYQQEGFQLHLAKDGKILSFCLLWPDLERDTLERIASQQQISACIRAFKTPSPPNGEEPDFFDRIKDLSHAQQLTITKITPYVSEGIYGETPTNNELLKNVMPLAELEATANFGTSNLTLKLLSPILSSEAVRLLK